MREMVERFWESRVGFEERIYLSCMAHFAAGIHFALFMESGELLLSVLSLTLLVAVGYKLKPDKERAAITYRNEQRIREKFED